MNSDYIEPVLHKGIFTPDECKEIIKQSEGILLPSVIGGQSHTKKIRNSYSAVLHFNFNPVIEKLKYEAYKLTGYPSINFEPMQISRYLTGGYYRPHQDAFTGKNTMRRKTLLICLNDDYEGGETNFPILGKRFKMDVGDVLVFNTVDINGNLTIEALHEGCDVTKGTKWILTIWIHDEPLVWDIDRYIKYKIN